jgi:hypothetical protein
MCRNSSKTKISDAFLVNGLVDINKAAISKVLSLYPHLTNQSEIMSAIKPANFVS